MQLSASDLTPTASGELTATVGKLEICYETFGAQDAAPLLLVMGLASQMILWDEEFCEQLAARGFWVIRFDNRDIGRSTRLRPAHPAVARGGHDRDEREDTRRMLEGHQLGDHAAHRGADDVRGVDRQMIEQADRIAGHVLERVGGGS